LQFQRFVALGDSFTEGLDDLRPDGTPRGWADMVADVLASRRNDFHYANLALRSLGIDVIVGRQLPAALEMRPDVASIAGGANDLLGVRVDVDRVVGRMDEAVGALRAAGAAVVVFAGFDPRAQLPTGRLLTSRTLTYNAGLRTSASAHGAELIDLWSMTELRDRRLWAPDRLHLSTIGHRHIARVVLERLGYDVPADWLPPLSPIAARSWFAARLGEVGWSSRHLAPWAVRKVLGRAAGRGRSPKYPELIPWPE
jgi:lysophospholipase L1-like esterase